MLVIAELHLSKIIIFIHRCLKSKRTDLNRFIGIIVGKDEGMRKHVGLGFHGHGIQDRPSMIRQRLLRGFRLSIVFCRAPVNVIRGYAVPACIGGSVVEPVCNPDPDLASIRNGGASVEPGVPVCHFIADPAARRCIKGLDVVPPAFELVSGVVPCIGVEKQRIRLIITVLQEVNLLLGFILGLIAAGGIGFIVFVPHAYAVYLDVISQIVIVEVQRGVSHPRRLLAPGIGRDLHPVFVVGFEHLGEGSPCVIELNHAIVVCLFNVFLLAKKRG